MLKDHKITLKVKTVRQQKALSLESSFMIFITQSMHRRSDYELRQQPQRTKTKFHTRRKIWNYDITDVLYSSHIHSKIIPKQRDKIPTRSVKPEGTKDKVLMFCVPSSERST